MNTAVRVLLATAIFGGGATALYFVLKRVGKPSKGDKPAGGGSTDTGGGTGSGSSTESTDSGLPEGSFPLKLGSKSKLVQRLQQALNDKYGSSLTTDGAMGEKTTKEICSKVFTYCISKATGHRALVVNQTLFNDIMNGKKRRDLSIPTSGFSGGAKRKKKPKPLGDILK